MLHDQLAWYVAGPILWLCVVAYRALFNSRLIITGGFSELVSKLSAGSVSFDWRGWFAIGIFLGGTVFLLAAGGPDFHGYGWLTRDVGDVWVAPILVVAGGLIGFGGEIVGG